MPAGPRPFPLLATLGATAVTFVAAQVLGIVGLLASGAAQDPELLSDSDRLAAAGPAVLAWIFLPMGVTFLVAGRIFRSALRLAEPPRVSLPRAVAWGAGLGVVAFASAKALEYLSGAMGVEVTEQPILEGVFEAGGPGLWIVIPVAVVLAPVAEELFFRGFVFAHLEQARGALLAYATSALLFGLVHLNASGMPIYFWFGLVFAWGYARTRSITVAAVAHGVANAITLSFALAA